MKKLEIRFFKYPFKQIQRYNYKEDFQNFKINQFNKQTPG